MEEAVVLEPFIQTVFGCAHSRDRWDSRNVSHLTMDTGQFILILQFLLKVTILTSDLVSHRMGPLNAVRLAGIIFDEKQEWIERVFCGKEVSEAWWARFSLVRRRLSTFMIKRRKGWNLCIDEAIQRDRRKNRKVDCRGRKRETTIKVLMPLLQSK